MDCLLCYPSSENLTREKCEKVHNILARMSEKYKLRIVPEPMKSIYYKCPDFSRKFRIYKKIRDRESGGDAYLEKDEEIMLLSECRDDEEKQLMKECIYAYQYESGVVLKAFHEREKKFRREDAHEQQKERQESKKSS
ncbi:MAG: hypothetical protein LIV11_09890 [Bacillota bacterium]|uniref:Uncharacterized protein n=1 Tax=[Clostridium] aminophilum TaxID=1526 RepID=A0A1I6KAP6_9FIRM|nr:hypothetical protein [[Clostridium] aminophilum]MDT3844864.1 hypothetical protein [Bacillota bacterium]SFR88291.1 hypothetical protein SAMN02910262_02407 [[Clostridium] aminophilum]